MILIVAAIIVFLAIGATFLLRGINLGNTNGETGVVATVAPNGEGGGVALPASAGMATFTPAPPQPPTAEIPTAAAPPAETPVPVVPTTDPAQAAAPTVDPAVQATVDAANAAANDAANPISPDTAGGAQPPPSGAGVPIAGSSNTNIQVTPVPAVPVNGSGGGTSGGNTGGNTGGSGSSGGGAACGTRLIHVVRPGENLFRIGLRYNTTAYAIARLNGITNVRLVASGRRLVIVACARGGGGGGGQYTPRSTTYVVKPGDTLFRIALRFGINTSYLCHVNGLTSNLIVPGQVLVIP